MLGRIRPALAIVLIATLAACDGPLTACDLSFGSVGLTVRRTDGSPVAGLAISDTILRTHQGFDVPQPGHGVSGGYIVIDDSYRAGIRRSGDSVRVAGVNATDRFLADFIFDTPGGCHVAKLAGPDTVIVP